MTPVFRWVVAFRAEAQPLIDQFRLSPFSQEGGPFPCFQNDEGTIELVVSGPGKVQAGAAVAALACQRNGETMPIWINFGIAGCGASEIGEVYLASRVVDESTRRSWFPQSVVSRKVEPERRSVVTVEKPTACYPVDGSLVEMEASGFLQVALMFSTLEWCHSVKVISDNPSRHHGKIDRGFATGLCEAALDRISDWVEALSDLAVEEARHLGAPNGLDDILTKFHFSVTRRHRLRRLLQQWQARGGDERGLKSIAASCSDGREFLSKLSDSIRTEDF